MLLLVWMFLSAVIPQTKQLNVGGIFDPSLQLAHALTIACETIEMDEEQGWNLTPFVKHTPADVLIAEQDACELAGLGVVAILGPNEGPALEQVQAVCDMLDIPHLLTEHYPAQSKEMSVINVFPNKKSLSKAIVDLIILKDWKSFTIIYEDAQGLADVLEVLHLYGREDSFNIRTHQLLGQSNYKPLLLNIKHSGAVNYLVQCDASTLPNLLEQAQQVGILASKHNYIITTLDFQTIDWEPNSYGGSNITGFRMYDPLDPFVTDFTSKLSASEYPGNHNEVKPENMSLRVLLIYDAIQVLRMALNEFRRDSIMNIDVSSLSCDYGAVWRHGSTIINYVRTLSVSGLTGMIQFDDEGFRTDITLDLLELNEGGEITKVGNWTNIEGFFIDRPPPPVDENLPSDSMKNRNFKVLIAISAPYVMRKDSTVKLHGNDRFEGFAIELFEELSKLLEFNVTFELDRVGDYGICDRNKTCSGMLKRVSEGTTDFAITDLTITSDREAAVDFTSPFLNLGISILYKKPENQAPDLFTFMLPFSTGVWLCVGAAYFLVSVLLFLLGRICPEEWQNPYPCIEEPEVLMNQFTFANALWFNAGAMLLQGSEIAPIAYGTRTIASMWWFFVLIITSSYTANLTAFLAVRTIVDDFTTAAELANNDQDIAYGAKNGGSTYNFFKNSQNEVYRKMYEYMKEHPEHMTSSNDEGLAKVKQGKYAYLMESTSIEYLVERECDVMQVGGLLDSKGYGIAMKKDSPYRNSMSRAVLKLQEQGELEVMKNKWWKEKRGGGACSESTEASSDELDLENVGGVFVVLALGCVVGLILSIADMLRAVKRRSHVYGVAFKEELMDELKFVFSLTRNEKPVVHQRRGSAISQTDSISLQSMNNGNEEHAPLPDKDAKEPRSPRQSFRLSRRKSSLRNPMHEGQVRLARQFTN